MDYAAAYSELHGKSEKIFSGFSIKNYLVDIAALVEKTGAKTLLDYGCGKGKQYTERRMHDAWGGILPTCYDVGVEEFSQRPLLMYDGVICTDVMEHIDEPDIERILKDVMGYARKFVFFAIACRKAKSKKVLPDGRNVHLTVQPPIFWDHWIYELKPAGLTVQVAYDISDDPA